MVEVPFSDGTMDENSGGRNKAVQDNLCRAFVPVQGVKPGKNTVRVHALDAGVVLDRLTLRKAPGDVQHPFAKATLRGTAEKTFAKAGEPIRFTLRLDDAYDIPEGKYFIRWRMFDDDGKKSEGKEPLPLAKPLVLEDTLAKPGFVRVSACVVDANGKEVRAHAKRSNERVFFEGGAGADVDRVRSLVKMPADFDEYWANQKKRLAATPIEVIAKEERPSNNKNLKIYAVKVACPGPRPVTGYLCVPTEEKLAKTGGKAPARVFFRGYGVHNEKAPTWDDDNFISFHVNAHGCELDMGEAFYRKLHDELMTTDSKGRRHEYGLNPEENANPGTSYFNGMGLRVLRALEFVKSLPEWNGKDLFTIGGSQGGLQSIWGGALDKDVTRIQCEIPWCCDMGPKDSGRIQQVWGAEWADGLAYYAAVNFTHLIKAPKRVEIPRAALGDELCPPAGVAAFYNALKCPKSIKWVQGSTHGYVPQSLREEFTIKE